VLVEIVDPALVEQAPAFEACQGADDGKPGECPLRSGAFVLGAAGELMNIPYRFTC